jgi:uncharacterized membrane protein SpoIIM required for sporulation
MGLQGTAKNSILRSKFILLREALFIKKNKERWLQHQQAPPTDPDQMASEFTQLVDDLAYAKTYYPGSNVTRYINAQASGIYLKIYQNRKEETNRLWKFWKYDLPLTIHRHHKPMWFSFALFLLFFVIGFFVAMKDESILRSIMGHGYVDSTHENIENGNPFGVYENGTPLMSWIWIMINNIRFSLITFSSGIFAGVPSMYFLVKTAVMVGAFDQMFAAKGLGLEFFMVVFVHGMLELTAIIIAAGAGIVLGKSFLFPGTIRRMDAFKRGAKDGVKIMIGLIPVFALAAFFEGFITRLYNDISVFTTLITSLSVIFVIWYFVLYPIRLARKMKVESMEEI